MPEIVTTIEIAAPPSSVWAVLADTRAYDEWNPFITRWKGALREGERISFVAAVQGRELKIDAEMRGVSKERELRWGGPPSPLLARVFRGEHYVRLEPTDDGGTRVTHGEQFGGASVRVLWGLMKPRLEPVYTAMNEALKERSERETTG